MSNGRQYTTERRCYPRHVPDNEAVGRRRTGGMTERRVLQDTQVAAAAPCPRRETRAQSPAVAKPLKSSS
ncbi:hypothetical protein J6590_063786 [Homalodisca vitripennis]|nr:hypothetical protein J6590_063786 [Homalodisca vitripennis]